MLEVVAYIDAGTGSYLLAALVSGVAGLWLFIRTRFARFVGWFSARKAVDDKQPSFPKLD